MTRAKILIVEDEVILARELSAILEDSGYEVIGRAATGEEAVTRAEQTSPDLVLMDIKLKGDIDGIQVARDIADRTDAAIVYLTAHTSTDLFQRAKITEPFAYLTKPVSHQDLERTIEMALYKSQMGRIAKESEQKFRSLYSAMNEGVALHEPVHHHDTEPKDYRILDVNPAYVAMTGISRENAIGALASELYGEESPSLLQRFARAAESGKSHSFEVYWESTNKYLNISVYSTDNGEFATIFRDITERKTAEAALRESRERLETLFHTVQDFQFVTDTDARILEVNATVLNRLGYSAQEVSRMTLFDLHPPARRAEAVASIADAWEGKSSVCAVPLVAKGGTAIPVETKFTPGTWGGRPVLFGISRDITDRIEAEKELERQYKFLTTVLESLTHAFYVVNVDDYSIELANRAAVAGGASKGSTCYKATHCRDTPCNDWAHPCPLNEVVRTGRPAMVEHLHFDEAGRARNIEVHAYPVLDEQGRVIQSIQYCLDITDRVEAQNALRENEMTLNTILSMSPSGIAYFRDGKIAWANRAMRELFGCGDDEKDTLLGSTAVTFYESEEEYARVRQALRREIAAGRPAEAEARFRMADGSIFIGRFVVSAPRSDDPGKGVTVVISDVTGRKKAQEERSRLATIVEQSAESIVVTDPDGTIQYVNPAFEKLTGYSAQETAGKTPRILKSGVQNDKLYCNMWQALTRGDVWRGHLVNKRKDGTLFEEEATISPVRDESGTIVSYVGVKRDVTDQVLLEKQLQQAQKMESVGTLASGIAHDFNNLLQIVLGYTDILMMAKEEHSPDLKDLACIRKAARDGGELIRGLLTFSREVESKLRPTDLNLELKQIREMLRRTIPRMIEIEFHFAENLKATNADPIQMQQVLMNLCVNARQAMPKGGRLTIQTDNVILNEEFCKTHLHLEPGEYVLLEISDTGHGMKREVVERIFEPFYTTKSSREGTGLGLAIVYGIVKNHGGHIVCDSMPDQGTRFSVYFPAIMRDVDRDEAFSAAEMPPPGNGTILLADDEEGISAMVEGVLTRNGYRVLPAGNGREALQLFRQKRNEIDLVILDLVMPEMGGEQCLDEILKIDPNAKVLVASGYWLTTPTMELLRRRATGFIGKPFEVGELFRAIREALGTPDSLDSRTQGSEDIPVESSPGHEAAPGATVAGVELPCSGESPDSLRILAIDDRQAYLTMLELGLVQFGHQPLIASSSREGLRIFNEFQVDLVICDLGMPAPDGWEVSKCIKETCRKRGVPKTPFILLTGRAEKHEMNEEDREEMQTNGVDAIVGKPVDIPDLLDIAQRLLRMPEEDSDRSIQRSDQPQTENAAAESPQSRREEDA